MLEASPESRSDQPTKRAIHPIYVKALIATVALLVLGPPGFVRFSGAFASIPEIWWRLELGLTLVTVALIAGTLILAPIAMRRIRSQPREASRSYGVMAALASASGVAFGVLSGLWSMIMFVYGSRWLSEDWPYYLKSIVVHSIEYSVVSLAAAWATLALTGAGRRSSGMFERFGLALGLLWIATYVARHALDLALRLRF